MIGKAKAFVSEQTPSKIQYKRKYDGLKRRNQQQDNSTQDPFSGFEPVSHRTTQNTTDNPNFLELTHNTNETKTSVNQRIKKHRHIVTPETQPNQIKKLQTPHY